MSHRLTIAASIALLLMAGAALAQADPQKVGISVNGAVVEVPVDLAAKACGIGAETLTRQWDQLGTQMATMENTTVGADATDLAPVAAPDDPQKASGVGGEAGTAGDKGPASDTAASPEAADGGSGESAAVAAAASPRSSAAENPRNALGGGAAPTEGTALSKAAVCEIDAQKAAELGIEVPG